MSRPALLSIDLGTSGVKVLVASAEDRQPLAQATVGYPITRSRRGWAETDPAAWWAATVSAVRSALADAGAVRIAGIGVDGQMHGLVLSDAAGRPVRPALLWADRRAAEQLRHWRGLPEPVRRRLANPITPGMTGPMWAWVAEHEPTALAQARWALLPKDWLRLRLTGAAATEPSDASATLLWDVPGDRWDLDVVSAAGLDPALLPSVLPSAATAGQVAPDAAADTGLRAGTLVATGAGDTAAGLLGTGLTDPATVQITVGSGGQIVRPLGELPGLDIASAPVVHTYRTAAEAGWYAMAAVQNAGLALDWVREVLGATWAELYGSARAHAPGAGGVTFVPYLTGERTPVLSAGARGGLFGLDQSTDRAGLLQAALEGVCFAIRHALEAMPGSPPTVVRLAGGGGRQPGWRTLLADVLGVRLEPVSMRSASAVGSAVLAGRAAGLRAPAGHLAFDPFGEPAEPTGAYEEAYALYRQRCPGTAET